MNVKTISVTYERKFNLGEYNMLHLGVTLWADLDGNETGGPVVATQTLQTMARELVKAEYSRLSDK